jgi:hypothetical protein
VLTKETFLQLFKRDEKAKEVKVAGRTVWVRQISWGEKKKLRKFVFDDKKEAQDALLLFALCDENGNRLFTDDDYALLDSLPPDEAELLADAAWAVSGLGKKESDELKKNSGSTETTGSSSSSA